MFTDSYGNHFVVTRYTTAWTSKFLHKECDYDCFVVNRTVHLPAEDIGVVAATLADRQCKWIEVFGFDAERLHDAIDEAAVAIGRQTKIGDGDPMTSWNDESITESEIAAYVLTGGQGTSDWKLVLVIGDENAERQLSAEINSVGGERGHR